MEQIKVLLCEDSFEGIMSGVYDGWLYRNKYGRENVVYLKGDKEIDFYIEETNTAIQVSYSIKDDNTRNREVDALCRYAQTNKDVKPMIITWEEKENLVVDGVSIEVVPVLDWILDFVHYTE